MQRHYLKWLAKRPIDRSGRDSGHVQDCVRRIRLLERPGMYVIGALGYVFIFI